MQVDLQELYVTFLLLLVALFLQELARRITQPLSKLGIINYFDFVRKTILYPHLQKETLPFQTMNIFVFFTVIEMPFYMLWLAPVWLFAMTIPKVPIPEANALNFLYFILQFWVMFFIAVSVFLPYWSLGWLAFWKYERRDHKHQGVPYAELFNSKEAKDGRDFHKRHFALRVSSWFAFFVLTLSLTLIIKYLIPLHS